MVGSPPENITTSASPSDATNASSTRVHCSAVIEYPSGWWPESAKQIGQSRLQPVFTSRMPRHACCLCSGHSPQSDGQPSTTSVWNASGIVPGLLNRADAKYAWASPYTNASNQPCSRHRLRRYTLPARMFTCASTTTLHTGQMLLVYSTNTSSRSRLPAVIVIAHQTITLIRLRLSARGHRHRRDRGGASWCA